MRRGRKNLGLAADVRRRNENGRRRMKAGRIKLRRRVVVEVGGSSNFYDLSVTNPIIRPQYYIYNYFNYYNFNCIKIKYNNYKNFKKNHK